MPTPSPKSTISPRPTSKAAPLGSSQPNFLHHLIRDTLPIQTWLALGAALQLLLFLLPIRRTYTVLPVVTFLSWQIISTALAVFKITHGETMDGVVNARYTAVFPDEKGKFESGSEPGGEGVAVFILGFRCNHPLGILGPGFRNIQSYMSTMFKSLDVNRATNGYLGQTFYLAAGSGTTSSEIHTVYYFRTVADIHAFAVGPEHREGWNWYNKVTKKMPWLGIMHELYWSESGKWENVYANWRPSGFADTTHKFIDENGEQMWKSPIVEAKGRLTTSVGRLA